MIENDDVFNKLVGLINLNDAHFKVNLDNQSLILKNQELIFKELEKINQRLDKLEEK